MTYKALLGSASAFIFMILLSQATLCSLNSADTGLPLFLLIGHVPPLYKPNILPEMFIPPITLSHLHSIPLSNELLLILPVLTQLSLAFSVKTFPVLPNLIYPNRVSYPSLSEQFSLLFYVYLKSYLINSNI